MAGKLTSDGRKHIADRVENSLNTTALPETYGFIEIGIGTKGNLVAGTALQLNASVAKGVTSVVLKDSGGVLTGSLTAGDIITFANDDTEYEVANNATAAANLITLTLANALVVDKTASDGVATSLGGSDTTAGCRDPLASGSIVALTSGWPKTVAVAGGQAIEFKASFPAGTFTIGTSITEACVRQLGSGGKCFAYTVLDTPQNPSASQSLDVTLQYPIVAGI